MHARDSVQRDKQIAVVIVGAGPTGLAAANLLGQAGIETLLIERNADLCSYPRAISIDDEGLRICQAMGLADEMLTAMLPGIHAHYLSGKHYLAKVAPTSMRNGYPLLTTFHQPAFERTLLRGLARFPCVEVLFQHTLETFEQHEQGIHLSLRTPDGCLCQVECAYLLACDGGKSSVRHALGISLQPPLARFSIGKQNGKRQQQHIDASSQRWLVVDCIDDDDSSTAALFFCNPKRPAVTVPAPHNGRRWEFMLLPGERSEDLLTTDTIQALIKLARLSQPQSGIGKSPRIIRQAVYTFHSALAPTFSRGRVFLLGDAAHLMPPFGGQGMNSGLRDAHNLCWKLQMVLQELANPGLLETYHSERYPHVEQMILFSSLLGKIVMPTHRLAAILRDSIFRGLIQHIPPIREALTEMRVKPQPRYSKGFLLPSSNKIAKTLVGTLLPQPLVKNQQGLCVPLDDILGHGFSLLRLYENPEQAFVGIEEDKVWERLGMRCVCVQPMRQESNATYSPIYFDGKSHKAAYTNIIDSEGKLETFLHGRRDLYVLVRPDRYVMSAFRRKGLERVIVLLQRLMIAP